MTERKPLFESLQEFYGIGPVLAKSLISLFVTNRVITAEQSKALYSYTQTRQLLLHPQVFPTLPDGTQVELNMEPIPRSPRELIEVIDKELQRIWQNQKPSLRFEIAGSYIRKKPTSGDIDFILQILKENPQETWEYFSDTVNKNSTILKIEQPFAQGPGKVVTMFSLIVPMELRNNILIKGHLHKDQVVRIKVDTFLTLPEEYIFARLYAIGSGNFNLRMRALAKRKGYLLNQKGLYRRSTVNGKVTLTKVPIKNEKEIFEKLGMRYRPPEERTL